MDLTTIALIASGVSTVTALTMISKWHDAVTDARWFRAKAAEQGKIAADLNAEVQALTAERDADRAECRLLVQQRANLENDLKLCAMRYEARGKVLDDANKECRQLTADLIAARSKLDKFEKSRARQNANLKQFRGRAAA